MLHVIMHFLKNEPKTITRICFCCCCWQSYTFSLPNLFTLYLARIMLIENEVVHRPSYYCGNQVDYHIPGIQRAALIK